MTYFLISLCIGVIGIFVTLQKKSPWLVALCFVGTVAPWTYKFIVVNKEYDIAFGYVLISFLALTLLLIKIHHTHTQ